MSNTGFWNSFDWAGMAQKVVIALVILVALGVGFRDQRSRAKQPDRAEATAA